MDIGAQRVKAKMSREGIFQYLVGMSSSLEACPHIIYVSLKQCRRICGITGELGL